LLPLLQVMETVARILQIDSTNIKALGLTALHSAVRDGNNKAASLHLQDVLSAVNRMEPRNAELYLNMCQVRSP
jgi:tetratricopeptide repeat protein 21B